MSGYESIVTNYAVVFNEAVVADVGTYHEEVVVADYGFAMASFRTATDINAFAEGIVVADD